MPDGKPDVLLLATGSEVSLCLDAYEQLKAEGIKARVVSMPSWEMFEQYCREHPEYREQVLPRVGERAGVGGTGIDVRLGAVRRPPRPQHRHEDLRGVGAAEGIAEEVRLYARERHPRRQRTDRQSEVKYAHCDRLRSRGI